MEKRSAVAKFTKGESREPISFEYPVYSSVADAVANVEGGESAILTLINRIAKLDERNTAKAAARGSDGGLGLRKIGKAMKNATPEKQAKMKALLAQLLADSDEDEETDEADTDAE